MSRTILSNALVLALKQAVTWSLAVVLVLFAPRYLGDEGMGKVTFATSFAGLLLWLVLLGSPLYLVKAVARDRRQAAAYFANSLAMRLPLAGLVLLIVFVSQQFMGLPPETSQVVYLATITMAVLAMNEVTSALIQALEEMKRLLVAEVAGKLVLTVVGVGALMRGEGVVVYAAALLLGATVTLLVNASYFVRRMDGLPRLDLSMWKDISIGGLPFLLSTALYALYKNVDSTMLHFMAGEAVVGWYGVAVQLFATFNAIPLILGTAVLPSLARMHRLDPRGMVVASRRSLGAVALASAPVGVGLALVSDKVIHLFGYPESFSNSIPLIAILSASLPITGALMVMGTVAAAADRQGDWAKITLAGVALNVALNLAAIPPTQAAYGNGAIGAAAATVASEGAICLIGLRLLPAGVANRGLAWVLARTGLATGIMGVVVWMARGLELAPLVLLGAAVYGALVLALRLVTFEEVRLVRQVVLRRGAAGPAV